MSEDTGAAIRNLLVTQTAPGLGADAAALLDSRAFRRVLNNLDAADPDFAQAVGEAITTAVEADPRYKTSATPSPGTSAGPASSRNDAGPEGDDGQWTLERVRASTPAEVTAAMEAGHLVGLGMGPRRRRR